MTPFSVRRGAIFREIYRLLDEVSALADECDTVSRSAPNPMRRDSALDSARWHLCAATTDIGNALDTYERQLRDEQLQRDAAMRALDGEDLEVRP